MQSQEFIDAEVNVKLPSDFPLRLHRATGQWRKTIQRRDYYFGSEWQEALARYNHALPYLERGLTPPPLGVVGSDYRSGVTIAEMVNRFLDRELQRYRRGAITLESWTDERRAGEEFVGFFGRTRSATSILPDEFASFRHWLQTSKKFKDKPRTPLGPAALDRRINYLRICFKWALSNELIDRPVRLGDGFNRVQVSERRAKRNASRVLGGHRRFGRDDIQKILAELDAQCLVKTRRKSAPALRAMFLLGLNGGYGQSDLAALEQTSIDFERMVIDKPRQKTGAVRLVPLWERTIDAMKVAIAMRPKAKGASDADLVFLTRTGKPWVRSGERTDVTGRIFPSRRDAIAEEFGKLLKKLGLKRAGLSFYAVRHTFFTEAGAARDAEARKLIMGHAISDMGEWYDQSDDATIARLRQVTDLVESKLFGDQT